jgi:hypothetical protein
MILEPWQRGVMKPSDSRPKGSHQSATSSTSKRKGEDYLRGQDDGPHQGEAGLDLGDLRARTEDLPSLPRFLQSV